MVCPTLRKLNLYRAAVQNARGERTALRLARRLLRALFLV